ncbi:TPA: hypothetical protein HA246_06700 [Candidatus Woesearchaeota archaeon]|nr:hypothetical protein [Candidatus Woesearchaeota archaeon]
MVNITNDNAGNKGLPGPNSQGKTGSSTGPVYEFVQVNEAREKAYQNLITGYRSLSHKFEACIAVALVAGSIAGFFGRPYIEKLIDKVFNQTPISVEGASGIDEKIQKLLLEIEKHTQNPEILDRNNPTPLFSAARHYEELAEAYRAASRPKDAESSRQRAKELTVTATRMQDQNRSQQPSQANYPLSISLQSSAPMQTQPLDYRSQFDGLMQQGRSANKDYNYNGSVACFEKAVRLAYDKQDLDNLIKAHMSLAGAHASFAGSPEPQAHLDMAIRSYEEAASFAQKAADDTRNRGDEAKAGYYDRLASQSKAAGKSMTGLFRQSPSQNEENTFELIAPKSK